MRFMKGQHTERLMLRGFRLEKNIEVRKLQKKII